MTNLQEELKRLEAELKVVEDFPAEGDYSEYRFASVRVDDYRRIALAISAELTKAEEALGLCAVSMPIEAVSYIEDLEELVKFYTNYLQDLSAFLSDHDVRPSKGSISTAEKLIANVTATRDAYLRRKGG